MASTAGGEGPKQPSERTYGQRFLKALGIYNLVKDDAAYDPQGNDLITKAAFKAVVDKLGAANQTVADLEPVYDGAQDKRLTLYFGPEGLRKRVSMVRAVIGGLKVGKSSTAFLAVQRIGQEMVNYQKPAKEVANGTDPKRSTAQMSFGSLLLKGQEVLGVMKDMKGTYVTNNPLVTVAGFEQFLADLVAQDTVISDALKPLNAAKRERKKLFEGEESLAVRVAAMKSHVVGEMKEGRKSTLYKEMVKVRYQ
jgi:hypothetical protein